MGPIKIIHSRFVPLPLENVDTDQIIPARFLKATTREGFGKNLFRDWRYVDNDDTNLKKDFVLNQNEYEGKILVAGKNFGCGSSREQAPIALKAAGVSVVIANYFARIFFRNAINIGLPVLEIPDHDIQNGDELEIDLLNGIVKNLSQNKKYNATKLPKVMLDIMQAGGLVNYLLKHKDYILE